MPSFIHSFISSRYCGQTNTGTVPFSPLNWGRILVYLCIKTSKNRIHRDITINLGSGISIGDGLQSWESAVHCATPQH